MNLVKKELIGLSVRVIDSRNKANIGLEGRIMDETKNLLIIKSRKGIKKIVKRDVVIEVEGTKLRGEKLIGRPEERLKL